MKRGIGIITLLGVCGAYGPAASISWDLAPSSVTVVMGQPVSVDVISDKPPGRPPSIGAFDFDVTFDQAILSPTDVIFGLFLGDPSLFEALTDFSFLSGVVDFAAVSLLSPAELDALQPAHFTLATLSFTASASGTTSFAFSQAIVDDAFGNKIPEPAVPILLSAGLIALGVYRRVARS